MRIGQPHEIFPDDCSELYLTGRLKHTELLDYNTPVVLNLEGGTKVLTVSDGEGHLRPIIQKFKGPIKPRNAEQQFLNHYLFDDKIKVVLALGEAGTGKSLLAINAGLESGKRMIYSRAFTPVGAAMGYLPGGVDEKMQPWLLALQDTCEVLGMQEIPTDDIECAPITYMRGRSLSNRFVVVDEAQNLTYHEIKTLLTRLGDDCKVVLMGDPSQCDLRDGSQSGFVSVCQKLVDSEIVAAIMLTEVERGAIAALAVDRL